MLNDDEEPLGLPPPLPPKTKRRGQIKNVSQPHQRLNRTGVIFTDDTSAENDKPSDPSSTDGEGAAPVRASTPLVNTSTLVCDTNINWHSQCGLGTDARDRCVNTSLLIAGLESLTEASGISFIDEEVISPRENTGVDNCLVSRQDVCTATNSIKGENISRFQIIEISLINDQKSDEIKRNTMETARTQIFTEHFSKPSIDPHLIASNNIDVVRPVFHNKLSRPKISISTCSTNSNESFEETPKTLSRSNSSDIYTKKKTFAGIKQARSKSSPNVMLRPFLPSSKNSSKATSKTLSEDVDYSPYESLIKRANFAAKRRAGFTPKSKARLLSQQNTLNNTIGTSNRVTVYEMHPSLIRSIANHSPALYEDHYWNSNLNIPSRILNSSPTAVETLTQLCMSSPQVLTDNTFFMSEWSDNYHVNNGMTNQAPSSRTVTQDLSVPPPLPPKKLGARRR